MTHLMKDVVTDPGQAVSTLRWAVSEMTNRYPVREGVTIGDVIFEVKDWNVFHPDDEHRQMLKNINIRIMSVLYLTMHFSHRMTSH